jgi:hypothetical protein
MAMNKKPKPLRPSGPTKPVTKYTIGTPKKPVVKITKVTKPFKKATVKNPSAPSASGPRGGGVRVITKSETAMKKSKASVAKTGTLPITRTVTDSMKTAGKKSYKPSTGNQKLIDDTQFVKRNPKGRKVSKMVANKGNKPSKVTPKKNPPTPPNKSRVGLRRAGLRGTFGGGGGLFGSKNR